MKHPASDKQMIARSFSTAAARYNTWATAQARIAAGLARRVPVRMATPLIVELGCGTGLLSALLMARHPACAFIGIDLAEGMVAACRARWRRRPRTQFIAADAEEPAQVISQAGLVASSSTAQWFTRPADTLHMWTEALAYGGTLACSFLVQGSFAELATAYREALQMEFTGLPLWPRDASSALAEKLGLRVRCCEDEIIRVNYDSARDALSSFRQIGAVFKGQPDYRPLSPDRTRRLLAHYAKAADPQGRVPVTYHAQYLIAEKPL